MWSHQKNLLFALLLQAMEVRGPYITNVGSCSRSSSHSRCRPFTEFVEVVLLPLDEFQTKIDGESQSRCHGRPRDDHANASPFVFSQIYWRKKKSWWMPKCTSLAWEWLRPSLSPRSCPSSNNRAQSHRVLAVESSLSKVSNVLESPGRRLG